MKATSEVKERVQVYQELIDEVSNNSSFSKTGFINTLIDRRDELKKVLE